MTRLFDLTRPQCRAVASCRGVLPRLVRLSLIALSLASVACFDVTEEISLREDGSARYSLDVAIPQEAVSLGDREAAETSPGEGPPADLGSAFRRIGEDARRLSRQTDAVSGFDVSESIDGCGFRHFLLTMEVRDATQLAAAQQAIFAAVTRGSRGASRRERPLTPDLRVESLGGESLGVLRLLPEGGLVGASDEPAGVIARALGESALAGHDLRVIVRGPHVVSANGAIAEDRRSVVWRVPLSDVVTGAAFPRELRAEVRLPHPAWPFLGLLLVTGLLAGVAAIIWLRRREPATWRN